MLCAVTALAVDAPISFRNAFDGTPLDVTLKAAEPATDAVQTFLATGQNVYIGNADALAAGKTLYLTWCQSCHLADGSGRMGPSLIGKTYTYKRVATDVGMFEVVFGGAGGAMQASGKRMSQDDILKIIAYVRSLKK